MESMKKDIAEMKKDIAFIKEALKENFELSEDAASALKKARKMPEEKYVEL